MGCVGSNTTLAGDAVTDGEGRAEVSIVISVSALRVGSKSDDLSNKAMAQ